MARRKSALFAAFTFLVGGAAAAAPYPSRPITVVVPYSAGGTSDAQVRLFQEALSKELGQPIVVENKAGASGAIGAQQVARAKPDGYTLLYPNKGVVSTPLLSKNPPYDVLKDFKPVSLVSAVPMVLVTNKSVPHTDARAFFEYARKQPGGMLYASAGPGSFGHLSTVRMSQLAGLQVLHVPYKGEAATTMALRAGEVQMLLTTPSPSMIGQIEQGNLRLLGVGTAEPSPLMPGAAPLNRVLPGFVSELWFGLLAPADTPDGVVDRLNAALRKVMADPEMQKRFIATGATARTSTPAEFGQMIRSDHRELRETITQFNIQVE